MNRLSPQEVIQSLQSVLPQKDFIALHEPIFQGKETMYVTDCIHTGWVSSVGAYVDQFEQNLAEFTGVKKAVAVVNGTAALHICLKLIGVKTNDEVLIPSLTFVATANAVTYTSAIPHFVDVSEKTLGMDPYKLEAYLAKHTFFKNNEIFSKKSGRRISAMVPMHTFGHPVEMDKLLDVAQTFHLKVVEDAAESLGSYYQGKHTGNFGHIAALSFNGNKIITTGGGGAILTNDEELAQRAKHITTTAKVSHPYEFVHDEIGYNYRMPNLNAALGCAQLEQLPVFLKEKRKLANRYERLFSSVSNIRFFKEPENSCSNYWLNVLLLEQSDIIMRDQWLDALNQNGIMSRPIWKPIHQLEMYRDCPAMPLDTTMKLAGQVINIPSSANLNEGL